MLKKIVLTLAIVAFAANAFAALALSSAGVTYCPGITFVPSKSVVLGYEAGTGGGAAGSTNAVYSIASKNTAGDKIYATTSASTAVVWKVGAAGSILASGDGTGLPATPSDSTISGTGWSVL